MEPGENLFVADANGQGRGRPWASLTITNHVRGGPILLGSQAMPWVCATPTPVPAIGQHAGVERQRSEHLRRRRAVQHRDRVQAVLPDDDARAARPHCPTRALRPPRRRTTASSRTRRGRHPPISRRRRRQHGTTVPYIVRVERGTMNRGIYDIAVLFDPSQAVDGARAAGRMERQGRLQLRGVDRVSRGCSSAPRQNWADDAGAVARLHGGRQQRDRLARATPTACWSPRR